MRPFDDIVPRTEQDEILAHIYTVLVEIRDALAHPPIVVSGPVPAEMPLGAGVVEAVSDPAPVPPASEPEPEPVAEPEPEPEPAPKKAPAKKPARKKPA